MKICRFPIPQTLAPSAVAVLAAVLALSTTGCSGGIEQGSDARANSDSADRGVVSDSPSPVGDSSTAGEREIPDGGQAEDGPAPGDAQVPADATPAVDGPPTEDAPSVCPPPTTSGETVNWIDIYGQAWPGPVYVNVNNVAIPNGGYLAIRFDTGSVADTGSVYTIENTTVSGVRFGSISACPGEIHGNLPSSCKNAWGIGGTIDWSTESPPNPQHCALKANTTYYFNLSFVDSSGVDTCVIYYGSQCTTTVSASNQP